MTTYATGNPLGSTAVKDLYDNAENLDYLVNGPEFQYPDRFGAGRKSYKGIENDALAALEQVGYIYTIPLNYAAGITITLPNEVFNKDGEYYKPAPGLSLPYVTTGVWASEQTLFRSVGDATLRSELASAATGAGIVGATTPAGSASTVQAIINTNNITVDSVAAARLVPATATGIIETVGYYAGIAGGSGRYRADLTDVTSTDDGFLVLVSTGGVRRKLIYTERVTVKQAGAKGDYNKTSDTGTDDTARIQLAHTNTPSGIELFYPLGQYLVTSTIVASGGSNIKFQSRATTIDDAKCALVGPLTLDGIINIQSNTSVFSSKVENMVVTRRPGTFASTVRGIITSGTDQTTLIDCAAFRHGIGLHANGQLAPYYIRLNTWSCSGAHVKISNCVEPRFTNCRFGRNGGPDFVCNSYVLVDGSGGIQVDTVEFLGCQFNQSGNAVNTVIEFVSYNNPNGIFGFTDCHMEMWDTFVVGISVTTTRLQRVKFNGCTMTSTGAQIIGGNMQGVLEDFQANGCTMAGILTLDLVTSASVTGGSLSGNLIINGGNTIVTGLAVTGNVTLTGTTGKMTVTSCHISGSLTNTYTGASSISGNI